MKWKCLKCGKEVDIWATVCPHCWRKPGGIIEHLLFNIFKWCMIPAIIIGVIFGNQDTVKQPNKQNIKTQQEQTSSQQSVTPQEVNYEEDNTLKTEVQNTDKTSIEDIEREDKQSYQDYTNQQQLEEQKKQEAKEQKEIQEHAEQTLF